MKQISNIKVWIVYFVWWICLPIMVKGRWFAGHFEYFDCVSSLN